MWDAKFGGNLGWTAKGKEDTITPGFISKTAMIQAVESAAMALLLSVKLYFFGWSSDKLHSQCYRHLKGRERRPGTTPHTDKGSLVPAEPWVYYPSLLLQSLVCVHGYGYYHVPCRISAPTFCSSSFLCSVSGSFPVRSLALVKIWVFPLWNILNGNKPINYTSWTSLQDFFFLPVKSLQNFFYKNEVNFHWR